MRGVLKKTVSLNQFLKQTKRRAKGTKRSLVTVSYAQSIDGCIAAESNYPLRLSCRASLRLSHTVRASHDAVLVGIGTVLADDPHLNVRHVRGLDPQPIILDSKLQYPLKARSLRNKKRPWIFTSARSRSRKCRLLEAEGAQIIVVPHDRRGHVNLRAVLKHLRCSNIRTLLVEGGSHIITSFCRERLVHQFVITIAPFFVGGVHAVTDLMRPAVHKFKNADAFVQMDIVGHKSIGRDIVIWGNVRR